MKKMIIFVLGIVLLCSIITATKLTQDYLKVSSILFNDNNNGNYFNETLGIWFTTTPDGNNDNSYLFTGTNFWDLYASQLGESGQISFGDNTKKGIYIWSMTQSPSSSNLIIVNSTGTTFNILSGSGNDFACLDSSGTLYRSDTACA